jgi:hypothetical protein
VCSRLVLTESDSIRSALEIMGGLIGQLKDRLKSVLHQKKITEGKTRASFAPPFFCVPSMVVSLNQRRRGGYLTATIQIPSWLPSCAALYISDHTVGTATPRKSKEEYRFGTAQNCRFHRNGQTTQIIALSTGPNHPILRFSSTPHAGSRDMLVSRRRRRGSATS